MAITLLVLITAFASLYGNLLGFSRISFAAARDGAFLPAFAKLHPRKEIPHVALIAVGALSLIASLFTLDQVIAFLTAGIVLIQGVAQIIALGVLRARARLRRRFVCRSIRCPPSSHWRAGCLHSLPPGPERLRSASDGWPAAASSFSIAARAQRWWPFLAAMMLHARAAGGGARRRYDWMGELERVARHDRPWLSRFSALTGAPFFVYGAAFFYERIPRDQWRSTLLAYKRLGINTIDLYAIWNWHAPSAGVLDFDGTTDPRRDLLGALKLTHELGFQTDLASGPGHSQRMAQRRISGVAARAPRISTCRCTTCSKAVTPQPQRCRTRTPTPRRPSGSRNATHLSNASQWLRNVLRAVEPYSHDIVAIALDDDQGAYLDNDTWPAPHWHAYVRLAARDRARR